MSDEPSDPNRDFKRSLRRLFLVIGGALVGMLALVWWLWSHSSQPP